MEEENGYPQVDSTVGESNQAFQKDTQLLVDPQPAYYSQQPQPGMVGYYSSQPVYYPPPSQHYQQQQTSTVFVSAQPAPVIVQPAPVRQSFTGVFVLACFVTWCCNWPLGLIALRMAANADQIKDLQPEKARKYGRASLAFSLIGIVISIVIVAVILGVSFGPSSSYSSYPRSRYVTASFCCSSHGYYYPGSGSYCYAYRSYSSINSGCYYYDSSTHYCYTGSYSLSASLCCNYNEYSYSDSHCRTY